MRGYLPLVLIFLIIAATGVIAACSIREGNRVSLICDKKGGVLVRAEGFADDKIICVHKSVIIQLESNP